MNKVKIVVSLLSKSQFDFEYLNKLIESIKLSLFEKRVILKTLIFERKNITVLSSNFNEFQDPYIRNRLLLVDCKFSNKVMDNDKFSLVVDFILSLTKKSRAELITSMIDVSTVKQLKVISEMESLKQSQIFNIIRRSAMYGVIDEFNHLLYLIKDDEKIKKIQLLIDYYSSSGISVKKANEIFEDINEDYFISYIKSVPKFDFIDEKFNFIDMRYSYEKKEFLYKLIKSSIEKKIPFSFLRLSDGESYGHSDDISLSVRQENHWWGEELSPSLREKIKKDYIEACTSIDINVLGLPTIYKYIHYISYNNHNPIKDNYMLNVNVVNRMTFLLIKVKRLIDVGKVKLDYLCEDQINSVIFNRGFLNDLSSLSKRVVVISGYKDEYIRKIINHNNLLVKEIPTHNLLSNRGDTVTHKYSLPYVYEDIRSWIDDNVTHGDLCLISAGFIGKILISDSFKKGGVVLDVGQAFKENI